MASDLQRRYRLQLQKGELQNRLKGFAAILTFIDKVPGRNMSDLMLNELKPSGKRKLDDLLQGEVRQVFGPALPRPDSPPAKDPRPKTHKALLAFLAPFRKLLRTS